MGSGKVVETFIKTYENAIPHVLCDMLIEKFDANTDQWENRDKRTEDRGNLKFNEVHLFKYMDTWKEEVQALADLFKIYVDDYKNQYNEFNGIYGETRRVPKEDLRDYMIKVLYQNPECKPEYVDASVNAKKTYFVFLVQKSQYFDFV